MTALHREINNEFNDRVHTVNETMTTVSTGILQALNEQTAEREKEKAEREKEKTERERKRKRKAAMKQRKRRHTISSSDEESEE